MRFDVQVYVGDPDKVTAQRMARVLGRRFFGQVKIEAVVSGVGVWGEVDEHTFGWLFLDLDSDRAAWVTQQAREVGAHYGQEAVGVFMVPAGSGVVSCR